MLNLDRFDENGDFDFEDVEFQEGEARHRIGNLAVARWRPSNESFDTNSMQFLLSSVQWFVEDVWRLWS